MKKLIMTTVLLGATAACAARKPAAPIRFNELDVDRDDTLTMTEAGAAKFHSAMAVLDRDGDGRLNRGEYAGYSIPAPAAGKQE